MSRDCLLVCPKREAVFFIVVLLRYLAFMEKLSYSSYLKGFVKMSAK